MGDVCHHTWQYVFEAVLLEQMHAAGEDEGDRELCITFRSRLSIQKRRRCGLDDWISRGNRDESEKRSI
jgi:hypothetical protein